MADVDLKKGLLQTLAASAEREAELHRLSGDPAPADPNEWGQRPRGASRALAQIRGPGADRGPDGRQATRRRWTAIVLPNSALGRTIQENIDSHARSDSSKVEHFETVDKAAAWLSAVN